jgi:hypothetical protein
LQSSSYNYVYDDFTYNEIIGIISRMLIDEIKTMNNYFTIKETRIWCTRNFQYFELNISVHLRIKPSHELSSELIQ